jgi:hypothetical protein
MLCRTLPYPSQRDGEQRPSKPPYLFTGAASGPQNLLHHDTVSGYGRATSSTAMACHHHDDDCANARTKMKAWNREHLRAFSFYFHTSKCCNPTPPFAYYKRKGRDPRPGGGETTPREGNVLSTHSNT